MYGSIVEMPEGKEMTKSEIFRTAHARVRSHIASVRRTDPRRAATMKYADLFARNLSVLIWDARNAAALDASFAAAAAFRANHPDRWY